MLVGIYVRDRLSVYVFHSISSSCEGMSLCSFCRPISAISLLKSPHNIYVWFGCAFICILIVCCIIGINLKSSMCEGMYRCIINHDCIGWFFMCMICRYGEMFVGVGIFVMFPRNAYFLFISVSRPPLAGVYGILCWIHLVSACVLLKINLWCRKRFWIYLVDLVAVSFIS